jgi:peptidoglycan/LPS O-acetylase OafA/YrhL
MVAVVLVWMGFPRGEYDTPFTFILNLFLLQGWGYPNSVSWNTPAWTISVEFFAYLLFPFILFSLYRWRIAGFVALVLAFKADDLQQIILVDLGFDFHHSQMAYGIYLVRYTAMFVVGMVAYQACTLPGLSLSRSGGDFLVAVGLFWLIGIGYYEARYGEVPYASVFLIIGLYAQGKVGTFLFGNRVSVFLGEISYALYLSHALLMFGLQPWWSLQPLWVQILIAIGTATALHYAIERPARRALRSMIRPHPSTIGLQAPGASVRS